MKGTAIFAGLLAFLLGVLLFSPTFASPADLQTTTFLNVGQGDSILIQDGFGFDILVDGGKPEAGPIVLDYLRSEGITELDVMLASHADSDHIGGLISVLQASDITVNQVLYNGYPGDTATWNSFVAAVADDGLTLNSVQFPAILDWGMMQAHILNPAAGLSNPETNDVSVVIRLDYGSINYLLTGDISSTIEATIIARETPIASEILKVAHHGSAYSTSDYFLSFADPLVSAISVGINSYGHPSQLTIDRIINSGSQVFRTDHNGNITISSDGSNFTVFYEVTPNYSIYLPIILNILPTSETPTPVPTATTGNIVITSIFYDGVQDTAEPDEYVEIKNMDDKAIQVQNWTLRDNTEHVYTFPNYVIQPGQICRVYTNMDNQTYCGFNYGSGSAIWNNSSDCAHLSDSGDQLIDLKCYLGDTSYLGN